MAQVGDAWWELHIKHTGLPASAGRRRAAFWYEKATAALTGIERQIVQSRLDEIVEAQIPSFNPFEWRVVCWQGHWNLYPSSKMKAAVSGTAVQILNNSHIHTFANLVYPQELAGDFHFVVWLRGGEKVGLFASDGTVRSIYFAPPEVPAWHLIHIRRVQNKVHCTCDGSDAEAHLFNTPADLHGFASISVREGSAVEIRGFELDDR